MSTIYPHPPRRRLRRRHDHDDHNHEYHCYSTPDTNLFFIQEIKLKLRLPLREPRIKAGMSFLSFFCSFFLLYIQYTAAPGKSGQWLTSLHLMALVLLTVLQETSCTYASTHRPSAASTPASSAGARPPRPLGVK